MGSSLTGVKPVFLVFLALLVLLPSRVDAFGAGNIASISKIEGKNWRHGDIEDVLKTLAFIKGHKWTSSMVKRVYFGNWLRDYSQAMDVGTLQKCQSETIRILVWVLAFMGFGYATGEYEVTAERLGVYRPEEHIDNPKDYADNKDARQYDQRLRPPVRQVELDIDPDTGMKNYIANERGDWSTSVGYVKYSLARSIHYGRLYANGGHHNKGREEDLFEALRCLGQGLHTLEDFGAHTNYVELVLREMGMLNVFPHTGTQTMMNIRGKWVFPLVTGTFGMVDFFHSVLGEATDHFAQSEMNEADNALGNAQANGSSPFNTLTSSLGKIPGMGDLVSEAQALQAQSQQQAQANAQHQGGAGHGASRALYDGNGGQSYHQPMGSYDQGNASHGHSYHQQTGAYNQTGAPDGHSYHQPTGSYDHTGASHGQSYHQPMGSYDQANASHGQSYHQHTGSYNQPGAPHDQPHHQQTAPHNPTGTSQGQPSAGMPDFDPQKTVSQIYPILAFRDKVVRRISSVIENIPGLESLVEKISDTLTLFVYSLLAPLIRPLIDVASKQLHLGSSEVVNSSAQHQYEPWTDPMCTDPTHSLLSKDHFSNILNEPAGSVAAEILKFVVPRVLYAWQHVDIPVDPVMNDCVSVFHHPAFRDMNHEGHRAMFDTVQKWAHSRRDGGANLDAILNADNVKAGKNHTVVDDGHGAGHSHSHGHAHGHSHYQAPSYNQNQPSGGHHQQGQSSSGFSNIPGLSSLSGLVGSSNPQQFHNSSSSSVPWDKLSSLPIPGMSNINKLNKFSGFLGKRDGDSTREMPVDGADASHGDQSQHQTHQDSGFNIPPPAGYEQYHQSHSSGAAYQPPEHGAHTYSYYDGHGGSSGGYGNR